MGKIRLIVPMKKTPIKKYSNKTAQNNWEWFLVYHGNVKCERCGYVGVAMDFHHLDPSQKKNPNDTLALNIIRGEMFKAWIKNIHYAFLCSNCHRELHAGVWNIDEIGESIGNREAEQARKSYLFGNKRSERLLNAILHSSN